MKIALIVIAVLVVAGLAAGGQFVSVRNDLVTQREAVNTAFSDVDVALQRRADCLLLITGRDSSEATGKLFEYLAAGRPLIALAADNEAARIVESTGTGVVWSGPSDPGGAVSGMVGSTASTEMCPFGAT